MDAAPPGDAPGWTMHQSPHATTFTRDAETLVLFPDGRLEFSVHGGPIDRDAARASTRRLSPPAETPDRRTLRRRDDPVAGPVKLQLASDPSTRALRGAGFAPSEEDDAIWVTAKGDRTVIWAGATVYGYVGHVPACIGAWEDEPDVEA